MSIIKVENLSKKYTILHRRDGGRHYLTLRDELTNLIFGRRSTKEDVWVLKNMSFQIEPGEIVGIIGPNGAGKTTLLKVLTKITPPTEGRAIINGRVGSLLEVGTGFHPELTGRENIYLNGAILGMKKKEIERKFNQIVDFAGIEKFLDTPAKRYSSGMFVRLAFSVAAHLEPDVLLVDEVLAVGDAEFQKKSLGRMKEITENAQRTILFVSHNMDAVRSLCDRVILIDKGRIKYIGDVREGIDKYLSNQKHSSMTRKEYSIKPELVGQVRSIELKDQSNHSCNNFQADERAIVEVCFEVRQDINGYEFEICLFKNNSPIWLSSDSDFNYSTSIKKGKGIYKKQIELPINLLKPGNYAIGARIGVRDQVPIDSQFNDVLNFNLILSDKKLLNTTLHPDRLGLLAVLKEWKDIKNG